MIMMIMIMVKVEVCWGNSKVFPCHKGIARCHVILLC